MKVKPRTNLMLDTVIFAVFAVAFFSGLVLEFVLTGGYRGGRNPDPAMVRVFLALTRHTWDRLHTLTGIGVGLLVSAHLALHMPWIVCQIERLFKRRSGANACPDSQAAARQRDARRAPIQ